MNEPKLLPDDPRLTAYALGELAGDERAAVEAALRDNPALRDIVDDIRATATQLEAALASEPFVADAAPTEPRHVNGHAVELEEQPSRVGAASGRKRDAQLAAYDRAARAKLLQFPQFYYVVGGLAAACFAVFVGIHRDDLRDPAANGTRTAVSTRLVALPQAQRVTPPAVRLEALPEDARESFLPPHLGLLNPPQRELAADNRARSSEVLIGAENLEPAAASRAEPVVQTSPAPANASVPSMVAASAPSTTGPGDAVERDPRAKEVGANRAVVFRTPQITSAEPAPAFVNPGATSISSNGSVTVNSAPRTVTGDPEVVQLQPFNVTTVRERESGRLTRTALGRENRRHLPRAPIGAQFGRTTNPRAEIRDNGFVRVVDQPHSTFSADVDSAGYSNLRRMIERGQPPTRDAVRIEQMLNYFPYRYAAPRDDQMFAASLEVADAPWAPRHRLVRIGLRAREVSPADRPAANLVFLIDVSASMDEPSKLPLAKEAMRLLVGKLRPDDRVAIVTYAGNSGLVLPPTRVTQLREILNALETLVPRESPSRVTGIQLAYEVAEAGFVKDGINRVILCTDGDFSLGPNNDAELMRVIGDQAGAGVHLTVLGFGMSNAKDGTLERLAQRGEGHYGYIDSAREAHKLLSEQVSSTLVTIAKDVKIDVAFNPAMVASYRLIGYENRLLNPEDFDDEKVDAGEIGAGQMLTALYEIVPVSPAAAATMARSVAESRYASNDAFSSRLSMPSGYLNSGSNELLTVRVRFKKPSGFINFARTLDFSLTDRGAKFEQASSDFRFAAAVAQFGMMLRNSPHRGTATFGDVIAWAANAAVKPSDDPGGYRGQFIDLVRKAQVLLQ